jgi:hypothetical protein
LLLFLFGSLGIVLTERCTKALFEFSSQRQVLIFDIISIILNENEVGVVVV